VAVEPKAINNDKDAIKTIETHIINLMNL